MSPTELDVEQWDFTQRLELISRLWDSIPNSMTALPMPEWHREELERRIAAADADPSRGRPLEDVIRDLRGEK